MSDETFHSLKDITRYRKGHEPFVLDPADRFRRTIENRTVSYAISLHQHPHATSLLEILLEHGVEAMMAVDTPRTTPEQPRLATGAIFTKDAYTPSALVVAKSLPTAELDFGKGAYASYNWELFFHIPLTLALHHSKSGRYEAAQRWLHLIFDPTDNSSDTGNARYWKFAPFRSTPVQMAEDLLLNLATGKDAALKQAALDAIEAWRRTPFQPHAVAKHRRDAYMVKTLMAYLDNLVAWGDSLFREDTRESVNEAFQLYVLASQLLGPRPRSAPRARPVEPQTYKSLRHAADGFSHAMRELETEIAFGEAPVPTTEPVGEPGVSVLESIGRSPYFCVPANDKLLGYWDTVADRLFKIRNSLNLQGVFRQLPLFEPPIDPALLIRAAAAGVDLSHVGGVDANLPTHLRFRFLLDRAVQAAHETQALGAALLSAMEKEDGEALQVLRLKHERATLGLGETIRFAQTQEAAKSRAAVELGLAAAVERYSHFEQLLGRSAEDIQIPELDELDIAALEAHRLRLREPNVPRRDLEIDIASGLSGDLSSRRISSHEAAELERLAEARASLDRAAGLDQTRAAIAMLPNVTANLMPMGAGTSITFGSQQLEAAAGAAADRHRTVAEVATYLAGRISRVGGFARREQDWAVQSNAAAADIRQQLKQVRIAQLREALAELELRNQRQQMRHAEELNAFHTDERKGKVTGGALYAWMNRELRGLYGQALQQALDLAKAAEAALERELRDAPKYIGNDYMAGRQGLLSGERLLADLRRLEVWHLQANTRRLELSADVSLLQLDPDALLSLRFSGSCRVTIPEAFFDRDGAGHFDRRLVSVALSIPGVVGPHVNVRCRLTLVKSWTRNNEVAANAAAYAAATGPEVAHGVSIVTSTGQNDAGLFDPAGRDERYLPFENAGAVSEWTLDLPKEFRTFDYTTIPDVILHLKFTALLSAGDLEEKATGALRAKVSTTGATRLISVRHELPQAWAHLKSAAAGPGGWFALPFELKEEHLPYWAVGGTNKLASVGLVAATERNDLRVAWNDGADDNSSVLIGEAVGAAAKATEAPIVKVATAVGAHTLYLSNVELADLWLVVHWTTV